MKTEFTKAFDSLCCSHKCLIANTIVKMNYTTPKEEIKIKYGIDYGRISKGYSISEMLNEATKIYVKQEGISDTDFKVDDIYHSMIRRNSRGSKLYPILLELLEIDDELVDECYFSNIIYEKSDKQDDAYYFAKLSTEALDELYNALTSRDQKSILYLMKYINCSFNFSTNNGNHYIRAIEVDDTDIS